ncbi:MAG: phytanoyl-CoA dioxygenase family protein [Planctomycetota bacterium]
MTAALQRLVDCRPINAAFTAARLLRQRKSPRRHPPLAEPIAQQALDALAHDGLAIVPSFLSRTTCAALRAEIDAVMSARPDLVQRDSADADHRLFAFDRVSAAAARFAATPWLHELAARYFAAPAMHAFTMAGRLTHRPDNLGSGQGWHRDSFARQLKAIVYLTDVDDGDGPFQYVRRSARLPAVLRAMWTARLGYMQNRLSDAEVARIVGADPSAVFTATAPAGTLLLADTTGIHRGMPSRRGRRYALTNYVYAAADYTDRVAAHFAQRVKFCS